MTRHHLSLWLLLAAAFACFAALSAGDMPTVCGHTLKSSDIVPTLFSARSTDNAISTGGPTACPAADSTIEEVQFPVPDRHRQTQTILFIGDSMLEGLGPRLAAYASHNGHTLYNVVWYSSTSEVWGRSDKLQSYIRRLHPTYVIVCLGANELFVPRIAERRREYVEKSSPISIPSPTYGSAPRTGNPTPASTDWWPPAPRKVRFSSATACSSSAAATAPTRRARRLHNGWTA